MSRKRLQSEVNRVDACLALAIDYAPQLGPALCRLPLVERPGQGTFSVDEHGRIYVDPDLICLRHECTTEERVVNKIQKVVLVAPAGKWTIRQSAWVLVHEVWHYLREHSARSKRFYQEWSDLPATVVAQILNVYEDVEINADIRDDPRAELPGSGLFPETIGLRPDWHGLFEQIVERPPPSPKASAGSGKRGAGGGGGRGSKPSEPDPKTHGGSGAHGLPMPWELPPGGDPSSPDSQAATRGLTLAEGDSLRDAVAISILESAKERGTVPAGMLRWASGRLSAPEVNWRHELRAEVSVSYLLTRGAEDYSYSRPSRRGMFCGVIQPRLVRPVPDVAVITDTSSSMSGTDITAAMSEIEGVLRALGHSEIWVSSCDAEVSAWKKVRCTSAVRLVGGGGTDMRVAIASAVAKTPARVIVVLTDGITPWPDSPPRGRRVIAGMVGHEKGSFPRHPDWLRCVAIPKHQLHSQ